MLSRHGNKSFADLSPELSDELDWKAGTLRTLIHHLDITALAYEPVSGILAVGELTLVSSPTAMIPTSSQQAAALGRWTSTAISLAV